MVSRVVERIDAGTEPRRAEAPVRWALALELALPAPAVVHPAVFDLLHRTLEQRCPAVERERDALRFVCALNGDDAEQREADAQSVEAVVCALLGTGAESVTERELLPPRTIDELLIDAGLADAPPAPTLLDARRKA
jgi:hypothetical protein